MSRIVQVTNTGSRQGAVGNSYNSSTQLASYSSSAMDVWSQEEARLFTQWGSSYEGYDHGFNNPYFDYFFTGQDVQITIDGLTAANDILPIYSFGYNIQQQKQPIYGFWNYTYSAMLRGTRIVTGAFSIVSMYPYFLTSKIAKAASVRAKAAENQTTAKVYALRGIDADEAKIDKYWRRTYDDNLDRNQQHLFSVHPPFNLVIKYGLQDTSLVSYVPEFRSRQIANHFNNSDPMMFDYNERLIENPQPELDVRILIENIEITSKSIQVDASGQPLLETYSFIARDERILNNVNKTTTMPAISDDDDSSVQTGGSGGGSRVILS